MRLRIPFVSSTVVGFSSLLLAGSLCAQRPVAGESERDRLHRTPDWLSVVKHLPDPATASPQVLEMQADLLRVRRFPEDALDYYQYAIKRGGDQAELMNRIAITHLELGHKTIARVYLQQAVKMEPNDSGAWNNLGAVEYLDGNQRKAINDYKKAVKLNKGSAVYHSNLGTAYFDKKDFKRARVEMATAVELDPHVFENKGTTGVSAHILSGSDRAKFCFEMAKMYAARGNEAAMIHSLTMASEGGFDVATEMMKDKTMAPFRGDPRVVSLIQNGLALKTGQTVARGTIAAPLAPASSQTP